MYFEILQSCNPHHNHITECFHLSKLPCILTQSFPFSYLYSLISLKRFLSLHFCFFQNLIKYILYNYIYCMQYITLLCLSSFTQHNAYEIPPYYCIYKWLYANSSLLLSTIPFYGCTTFLKSIHQLIVELSPAQQLSETQILIKIVILYLLGA